VDIKDLTRAELEHWLLNRGEPPYRAGQVLKWVYQQGATDFAHMTNIPLGLRTLLEQAFAVERLQYTQVMPSADGTCKYLFTLKDKRQIESVLIPDEDRLTLCISSQVGCAMGCGFCATAGVRPMRDLTPGEIVGQVWEVKHIPGKNDTALPSGAPLGGTPPRRITNVVLMGMGEPLANYASVAKALTILTAEWGVGFPPRRIAVSTVGLIPQMRQLLEETRVNLAVSLTATTDTLRTQLMPINKRYPLEALLSACRSLPLAPRQWIVFEYVMLREVNDSEEDARRLVRLLHGIRAKVNLIPFNPFPGSPFAPTPRPQIDRFRQILLDRGVYASIRKSRGQDIQAACGQLAAQNPHPFSPPFRGEGEFPLQEEG
jgi:23S rRNA (adenine2503-C2)-methyltransferase